MENIPVENAEVDERGREMSHYCLGLPTILRRILEHLSYRELIELSRVNKLWNFEARSVMRERGNVRGNPLRNRDLNKGSCRKLVQFASHLEKMRIVPFTGLHVPIYHGDVCRSPSKGSLHPTYNIILNRLTWKHLSVRFNDAENECDGCPALLLVEKILEDYSGELEELSLQLVFQDYIRTLFQDRSLPCLKILTVIKKDAFFEDEHLNNAILKSLVAAAPNLQELRVHGEFNFGENILEGSSAVIVSCGGYDFRPLVHQVCESLFGSVKAEWIEILVQEHNINLELLNSFIPNLLKASRSSLKILRIDLLFAVPLMCYGVCLENVTTLQIVMNCSSLEEIEASILELAAGLDFTRVFPKLTEVMILDNYDDLEFSSDVISGFVERGTEELGRALPDRAINIKSLDLQHCGYVEDLTLQLMGRMFPDVTTLDNIKDEARSHFYRFPATFPKLEQRPTRLAF